MKKIMSVVLSVCMVVMMSVPAFAYSSSDAMKIQLSDQAMTAAVGGQGPVYATVTGNTGGIFKGTYVNGINSVTCNYTIKTNMDSQGNGGIIVQSGTIPPIPIPLTFSVHGNLYSSLSLNCPGVPILNGLATAFVNP